MSTGWTCRDRSDGKRYAIKAMATPSPITCITMNIGADEGSMPANESDSVRAIVTAGLAKLVELVKK